MNHILSKNISFRNLTFLYFCLSSIEIIVRYFFMASPISILLPTTILLMYLSLYKGKVNLVKYWYLFIPFLVCLVLHIYLFSTYPLDHAVNKWTPPFYLGYALIALLYTSPLLYKIVSNHLFFNADWESTVLFLLFISNIVYALGTLVIIHLVLPEVINNREALYTLLQDYWVECFLLIVSCIISAMYLLFSKHNKGEEKIYLSKSELEEYKEKVLKVFNSERHYLNPNFSMNLLALETGIDKSKLDYFFNFYLNKSFTLLTAEYRINHALKLMQGDGKNYTIEAIALESGYKSRVSFNKYFKQTTGLNPSEYIALLKK